MPPRLPTANSTHERLPLPACRPTGLTPPTPSPPPTPPRSTTAATPRPASPRWPSRSRCPASEWARGGCVLTGAVAVPPATLICAWGIPLAGGRAGAGNPGSTRLCASPPPLRLCPAVCCLYRRHWVEYCGLPIKDMVGFRAPNYYNNPAIRKVGGCWRWVLGVGGWVQRHSAPRHTAPTPHFSCFLSLPPPSLCPCRPWLRRATCTTPP